VVVRAAARKGNARQEEFGETPLLPAAMNESVP